MEKDLKILKSIALANGSKYFGLFEKHIPKLTAGSTVYLYMIGNLHCICEIIKKNPTSKYFICDTDEVFNAVQLVTDNIDISKTVDLYDNDIDMKFDCIIMVPPFHRNLPLKVLAKAIKYLKDEKSVCVNLSPVRWLQDPLAKEKKSTDYKRFEESVSKHLTNVEIVSTTTVCIIFGLWIYTDLAIYCCAKDAACSFDYEHKLIDECLGNRKDIFYKIYDFCKKSNMSNHIEFNLNGISVKFNCISGGYKLVNSNHSHPYINGYTEDGKSYADCAFKKKDVDENKQNQSTVKFNSIAQAKNFIMSVQTKFYMFVNSLTKRDANVSLIAIPWMGDSINPRTGLKGYESAWTDEDFYQFFNITSEEQKIIEDTMAKYVK